MKKQQAANGTGKPTAAVLTERQMGRVPNFLQERQQQERAGTNKLLL